MKPIRKRYFADGKPPETLYDYDAPRTISRSEQEQAGLVRRNYTPAEITSVAKRGPVQVIPVQDTRHSIDVAPQATQHIELRTSAVDRAKGFLLASVPLYAAFATAVVAVVIIGWSVPVFSLAAFVIFWVSFVMAWGVGYLYTLHVSAEGVSMYEARRKWNVIEREQNRRWDYYERQIGDE